MLKKRILSIVLALTMLMVPGAYAAQPARDDMLRCLGRVRT